MAELISRDALLKEICNSCDGWCEKVDCDCVNCKSDHRCDIVCSISEAPAIDAEPVKHGRWIALGQRTYGGGRSYTHYCSECGQHGFDDYKNCPNCGAKMDLEG